MSLGSWTFSVQLPFFFMLNLISKIPYFQILYLIKEIYFIFIKIYDIIYIEKIKKEEHRYALYE